LTDRQWHCFAFIVVNCFLQLLVNRQSEFEPRIWIQCQTERWTTAAAATSTIQLCTRCCPCRQCCQIVVRRARGCCGRRHNQLSARNPRLLGCRSQFDAVSTRRCPTERGRRR